jgi:cytochrome c biogenesis protein CcmG, thiol:disulfide interchange protein DsbE
MMSPEPNDSSDLRAGAKPSPGGSLLWLLGITAIGAAAFAFFASREVPPAKHVAVGRPAPEIDLVQLIARGTPDAPAESVEGTASLTGKPYEGKVTMLHFWGTWCPPCKAEYPHLVELAKELEPNNEFQFVSVSCEGGPGETFERLQSKTRKYYESIGAGDLPTYVDASGQSRMQVAGLLGAKSMMYPTTLIIDPNQRIAGVWQGYSDASLGEMKSLIAELLK